AAWVRPSSRAAAVKLPRSAAQAKVSRYGSGSVRRVASLVEPDTRLRPATARRCPDTRNHPNHRCARAAAGTIVGRRSPPEGPDLAPATPAARARIPAPDGRRRPRREAVPGVRSVAKVAIRGRTVEQRWLFALATALDTRPGLATVVASALGTA